MGFSNISYSTDTDVFNVDGVKAGDAAAMESKLQALIDGGNDPDSISDMMLAGVEQGPEWEAQLQFGTGLLQLTRSFARVFAAVGGNGDEVRAKLKQRFVDFIAGGGTIGIVKKVEVAGGGDGSNFMALAIIDISIG